MSSQIEVINSLIERLLKNESLEKTTLAVLESLKSELNAFAGVIFLIDSENKIIYPFEHTRSKVIDYANKILAKDPFTISFKLDVKSKVGCVQVVLENKIKIVDDLSEFFSPTISATKLKMIGKFLGLKKSMMVPILIDNNVVGVLLIVFKRDVLSELDKEVVQLYANLSGIALENQRNITKLQRQYELERETAAMLTHELKTPIAIAHNSSELLSMTLKKYEKIIDKDFLKKIKLQQFEIHESIKKMNRICDSIFRLNEVENRLSTDFQEIDLKKSIGQMVEFYRKYLVKDVKLEFDSKVDKGSYRGPGIQFEQVVSILLENAIKYTEKGKIVVDLRVSKDKLRCIVSDTCIGIRKVDSGKSFERFYRGKDRKLLKKDEGLGLGLYIAKKIVEKFNGKLEVRGNKPRGTVFEVEM